MSVNTNDFSYVLCPGSMPEQSDLKVYNEIFTCWKDVWSTTFTELNVTKQLFSDAFTRQDYIGALYYKNTCFALAFYRWADATRSDFSNDSYFSNWSPEHQKALCSRGNNIIVCSQFTVHPFGRGSNLGVSGKDLLMGIIVETYMNSNADAMTGAVRVDRGVNGAGERWGAYVIDRKVPCDFGEKNTDLIALFKDHINQHAKHPLDNVVKEIWNNRLVLQRKSIGTEFVKSKKSTQKVA